jgi:pimeloyl-ACP methyl ester carboxylesterase
MTKTVYIYINGILNFPGKATNWTGRAVTHTILTAGQPAEKVEYLSFATFHRMIGQRNRAKKLARTLSFYRGWNIHLIAHSNGGDVVFDALKYLGWPRIESITLFSPACGNDFRKLGVRAAQDAGQIGRVRIYIGGKDGPIRLASTFLGRLFGYGKLGKDGPVNHDPITTEVYRRDDWGHSDWWLDQNFPWTMEQILS